MAQANNGSNVRVHYTGKLEDGTVFDSSRDREPFEFEIGTGQVIPGFELGVIGMTIGENKTITIPANEAYGECRKDLIIDVNKTDFPAEITPEIGQQLQMEQPDGSVVNLVVTDIVEEKVTLDANHPLAGQTLIFEIELLEIS